MQGNIWRSGEGIYRFTLTGQYMKKGRLCAFYVPELKVQSQYGLSDDTSVFDSELVAILKALQASPFHMHNLYFYQCYITQSIVYQVTVSKTSLSFETYGFLSVISSIINTV